MTKPEWEIIHDHYISMLQMTAQDLKFFKELSIRHPEEAPYKQFAVTIKLLENELKMARKAYKDIYGFYPKR